MAATGGGVERGSAGAKPGRLICAGFGGDGGTLWKGGGCRSEGWVGSGMGVRGNTTRINF